MSHYWVCDQRESEGFIATKMLAILNVLKHHDRHLSASTVRIQYNNKTEIAYLGHEGGTKPASLIKLTYQIFQSGFV